MTEDFNIGQCTFCREGLMLIVKDPAAGRLMVMCDDCETMWPSPEDALFDRKRIPHNAITKVLDPTFAEVKKAAWEKFVTVSPEWFDPAESK
jgi:hypothetical protein